MPGNLLASPGGRVDNTGRGRLQPAGGGVAVAGGRGIGGGARACTSDGRMSRSVRPGIRKSEFRNDLGRGREAASTQGRWLAERVAKTLLHGFFARQERIGQCFMRKPCHGTTAEISGRLLVRAQEAGERRFRVFCHAPRMLENVAPGDVFWAIARDNGRNVVGVWTSTCFPKSSLFNNS